MSVIDRRIKENGQPDLPTLSVQGLVLPSLVLLLGFIIAAAVLLFYTAKQQNRVALDTGRHLAASAISVVGDEIASFSRDYTYWNETVENIVVRYDPEWAENNIGEWAIDTLSMDGSIVFGDGNRIIHQSHRADTDRQITVDTLPPAVIALLDLARQQAGLPGDGPTPAAGYFRFGDQLYVAAASAIVWEDTRSPTLDNGSYGVLMMFRTIGDVLLADLEARFLLDNLHVTLGGAGEAAPMLTLKSASGEAVGGLRWSSATPGTDMLKSLLAPATIATLFVLIVFTVILGRARRASMLVREYNIGLQAQTRDLVEARDSAESASRSKSQFLAMMSHELRTPLNAVIGFSDVIRLDESGMMPRSRILEYANDINASGVYLLDLINDILDMSKIEARRYELVEDVLSLDETIKESTALVRGLAQDKKIKLSSKSHDMTIRGDARAMKQIVVNLLSNAVKFSDDSSKIQIEANQSANGDAEIRVIDQGFGMTRHEVEKALTPFGQSTDAHVRNMQGTGLGLNICLALTELHGGTLQVDSTPGQGTTVTIRLPADRVITAV